MSGSNIQNKNNTKSLLQKKRTNKKKRRTAVSSSESSSSSSSSSDSSENEDEDMAIEVEEDANVEISAPQLSDSAKQKPKKSTLIRDDIQISDSEINKSILQNQLLLDSMPISEFINLNQINTAPELKQIENDINKKVEKLKNNKPVIDNASKKKFLTEVFKNYSDDINSLRESNDFNSKHSLTLLANLLKNGASMFDKETLDNILE
ncbi:hypothetical protein DAHU10_027540 [Hanseniaspora uvarum]|nr:hypothetical protein DAHU10_027540 [Hanseniaspora uvarum]